MIVDCHVNIFEDRHRDEAYDERRKNMRPGFSGMRRTPIRSTRR